MFCHSSVIGWLFIYFFSVLVMLNDLIENDLSGACIFILHVLCSPINKFVLYF